MGNVGRALLDFFFVVSIAGFAVVAVSAGVAGNVLWCFECLDFPVWVDSHVVGAVWAGGGDW